MLEYASFYIIKIPAMVGANDFIPISKFYKIYDTKYHKWLNQKKIT